MHHIVHSQDDCCAPLPTQNEQYAFCKQQENASINQDFSSLNPFFCQLKSQPFSTASTTYLESDVTRTSEPCVLIDSNATITANNSILLLVVIRNPSASSLRYLPAIITMPQHSGLVARCSVCVNENFH